MSRDTFIAAHDSNSRWTGFKYSPDNSLGVVLEENRLNEGNLYAQNLTADRVQLGP